MTIAKLPRQGFRRINGFRLPLHRGTHLNLVRRLRLPRMSPEEVAKAEVLANEWQADQAEVSSR